MYLAPSLKEATNAAYQKAFGGKNLGSTFEKVAKRVNKHFGKELYQGLY
jgi:hypothetical protein